MKHVLMKFQNDEEFLKLFESSHLQDGQNREKTINNI
jgi:hypothetical protein